MVKDFSLLIIECKTEGKEFDDAWKQWWSITFLREAS
jgi:hypothetical protein